MREGGQTVNGSSFEFRLRNACKLHWKIFMIKKWGDASFYSLHCLLDQLFKSFYFIFKGQKIMILLGYFKLLNNFLGGHRSLILTD